jgi:ferredoxin
MRTGVILLTSSATGEAERLSTNLEAQGIQVLQCRKGDLEETSGNITDFLTNNRLETVVICNTSEEPPPDSLLRTIEGAGLGRHAISWIPLATLLGGVKSSTATAADAIVSVNIAKSQRADYIRNIVSRMVTRSSKLSRRQLFRSVPNVLRVESDIPIVLADRCRVRSKSCNYCIEACPVNAVSAATTAVAINDRVCVECGACARDCPIGALQSASISDGQIIAMLEALASKASETNNRALVLTCPIGFERLSDEGRCGKHLGAGIVPVQIPCVSFIGSVQYLWAASLGVALMTVCPDISCKKVVGTFPLYQHVASSKNILKALLADTAASVHHFGLHANDSVVDIVSQAFSSTTAVGVSAKLSGTNRHELVVDAIRGLRTATGGIVDLSEKNALPLFDLKVDEAKCSFCEACQRDCPDHAISFTKSDEGLTFMFDPSLCGGCTICEKICPEKAITVSMLKDFSSLLEGKKALKAQDVNAKCESCGAVLMSTRSLTALKKKLTDQGATEATIKALDLCTRCKQNTLIRPLGQHMQI